MENRIYDEQLMGIERSEYLLIVLGKSYLKGNKPLRTFSRVSNRASLHFKVGLTGGAGRGTLFASVACPFTADVLLLTFPAGAFALLFVVGLLLDCDCASVDVTVVLETCRDPDDLRPLDEPENERWNVSIVYKNKEKPQIDHYLNSVNSDFHAMRCAVAAVQSVDFHFLDYRLEVVFL